MRCLTHRPRRLHYPCASKSEMCLIGLRLLRLFVADYARTPKRGLPYASLPELEGGILPCEGWRMDGAKVCAISHRRMNARFFPPGWKPRTLQQARTPAATLAVANIPRIVQFRARVK